MRMKSNPNYHDRTRIVWAPHSTRSLVCLLSVLTFASCGDSGSGPLPPFADFSFEQVNRTQTILFTADAEDIDTYEWTFGDGMPLQPNAFTHHTFCKAGEYEVRLRVSGPGGEDEFVRTVVVEPTPGAPEDGADDLCDPDERQLTLWADRQPGPLPCPDPVGPINIVVAHEKINSGQIIDRSVESECDCFGIEHPGDSGLPEPASVRFTHVAPDGTVSGKCEQNAKFALGLTENTGAACGEAADIQFDTNGLHSITATPNEGEQCDGDPSPLSAVRQFTIVP